MSASDQPGTPALPTANGFRIAPLGMSLICNACECLVAMQTESWKKHATVCAALHADRQVSARCGCGCR